MENESAKELDVAEPTTDDSTVENELNFDDSNEENNVENSTEENSTDESDYDFEDESENDESDDKSSEKNDIQPKEEQSKYAAARRKAEEETKIKEQEAYQKGMLAAYKGKVNPYTNTVIKDMTDIEVYEDMYKLSEAGKDPIADYSSYVADKKRTEAKELEEKQERETKAKQDVDEFSKNYPDVNLTSLLKDEIFLDYAEGKNKSLSDLYKSFSNLKKSFRNEGIKAAKNTIANINSSPGSLGSGSENDVDYNTMSKEDFEKEIQRVKDGF